MNTYVETKTDLFRTLRHRIEDDFFRPMTPHTLGLARIVVFGLILWKSVSRPWFQLADWPASLIGGPNLFGWNYASTGSLTCLTVVLAVAATLGLAGGLTRIAAATCLLVLFLFNAIDGGLYDSGWLLASFLLLLMCARSDDALSLKSLLSPKRPAPESWEYRWPIRAIQVATLLVYFQTGVFKLLQSGLSWFDAETLQGWYLFHQWTDSHYFAWGELLLEYPTLAAVSATAAMILECGCIAILLCDRLKWLFVPALFAMHAVIGLTLNIWFTEYFFILLLFFDWSWLGSAKKTGFS